MEMEEFDDDMVVLIIGTESDAATDGSASTIKVEQPDVTDEESDPMNVEHLIKTAVKYGESMLAVKREASDADSDDDDAAWSDNEMSLRGFDEEEHLEDFPSVDGGNQSKKINDGIKRTRMLKPWDRCSYIQKMIKECPSLRNNEEELINRVAKIMQETKPPKPPKDFYIYEEVDHESFYVCTKCKRKSSNLRELGRHYQDTHGERYLKCLACGVDFRSTSCLQRHETRCAAADAVIVLKARAIAVGNKGRRRPFLRPKLKPEKKKYTYKKTFSCSMCPATFTSRMPLDAHENLHRGERPYMCEFCLMPYASYMALNRHRQSHSGQVFICDHCERTFNTKYLLISHIATHSERRFKCNHCETRFSTKLARDHHVWRVHLNLPPPCACPICPKRYARNSNLKLHMKHKHGMELITRNMYIKSLPKLTEMELEKAKVIMKSESTEFPFVMVPKESTNKTKLIKKHSQIKPKAVQVNPSVDDVVVNDHSETEANDDENQIIVDVTDTDLSTDVLEFVQKLQADAVEEGRKVKVILMDNGSVVHLVETEADATKLLQKFKQKGESVAVEPISEYKEMTINLANEGGNVNKSVTLQIQKDVSNDSQTNHFNANVDDATKTNTVKARRSISENDKDDETTTISNELVNVTNDGQKDTVAYNKKIITIDVSSNNTKIGTVIQCGVVNKDVESQRRSKRSVKRRSMPEFV